MSEQVTLPEAPFSANTRFIDRDGYDWQLTIRAASLDELIGHISTAKSKVLKNYQPAGSRTVASGSNGNAQPEAKICPIHQVKMGKRTGKGGDSWYSHKAVNPDTDEEFWCRGEAK